MSMDRSADPRSPALRRAAVWGAGVYGRKCRQQLAQAGVEVACFLDRTPPPDGLCEGVPVRPSGAGLRETLAGVDAVFLTFQGDKTGVRRLIDEANVPARAVDYVDGSTLEHMLAAGRRFLIHQALAYDAAKDDARCIAALVDHLAARPGPVALYGAGRLARYLLAQSPRLVALTGAVLEDDALRTTPEPGEAPRIEGVPVVSPAKLGADVRTVFLASTRWRSLGAMERRLRRVRPDLEIVTLQVLEELLDPEQLPARAFRDVPGHIYPCEIPAISVEPDLDFLLLDLPARFLGLMPNGLAHVHAILGECGVRHQTLDLDIVCYHDFHGDRLLDGVSDVPRSGGTMDGDPWSVEHAMEVWHEPEFLAHFAPEIARLVNEIVAQRPKILGVSLHGTNTTFAKRVIDAVRARYPEVIVIAGGYDCVYHDVGPHIFPEFDYMLIGEAEEVLPGLLKRVLSGETPRDLPGVRGQHDTPYRSWTPGPMPFDLDRWRWPRYEWCGTDVYRNWDGMQAVPIVLSRGCRWSRCTFCMERFKWRARSAGSLVDEIQFFYDRGARTFLFNDSDLSGNPPLVAEIADEIARRDLDLTLAGQLRVHKLHTQEYFERLKRGRFVWLRFGVDGWSDDVLRRHNKGYTIEMVDRTLANCHAAGIPAMVNIVLGVPGETEDDVDQMVENLVRNKPHIVRIDNIHTLMLARGGLYWDEPEKYGIRFRGDANEIRRRYPKAVPPELWYSVEPYIDQDVRQRRLVKLCTALVEAGFDIGEYAQWAVRKLSSAGLDQTTFYAGARDL